jgi:N-acetylglucosamine malate deacetylase 1
VLRVLCIGAHQDDCEGSVGGTAHLMRRRGDWVKFVSVTDGRRGHFDQTYLSDPQRLIERRAEEARHATEPYGIEYECLGVPDGEVYVTPEITERMIRLIRNAGPDLVLLNRPNDYHRDHRYTAQIVLDASYMLTVPFMCPDTPIMQRMPVFAYWQDGFTEGAAFRPDFVVPIDGVIDQKAEMMLAHESQYLEWLPFNASPGSPLHGLPDGEADRRAAVRAALKSRSARTAAGLGADCQYAEAFQISEYGSPARVGMFEFGEVR